MQQLNHSASDVKHFVAATNCFAENDPQNAPALATASSWVTDIYTDLPAIQSLDDELIAA